MSRTWQKVIRISKIKSKINCNFFKKVRIVEQFFPVAETQDAVLAIEKQGLLSSSGLE